jgi:hypothetical protein
VLEPVVVQEWIVYSPEVVNVQPEAEATTAVAVEEAAAEPAALDAVT